MMSDRHDIEVTLRPRDPFPSLRLERVYDVPVDRAWRAISSPAEINVWWAPMKVDLELEPGGTITFGWPGGEPDEGRVLEVEAPTLLAYRWDREVLRWELRPDGDGCVLTLTTDVQDPDHIADTAAGWHTGMEMLADLLAGREVREPEGGQAPEALAAHYRKTLMGR